MDERAIRAAGYSQLYAAHTQGEITDEQGFAEVTRRIEKRSANRVPGELIKIPGVTVGFYNMVAKALDKPEFAHAYPELFARTDRTRAAPAPKPKPTLNPDAEHEIYADGIYPKPVPKPETETEQETDADSTSEPKVVAQVAVSGVQEASDEAKAIAAMVIASGIEPNDVIVAIIDAMQSQ